MLWKYDSTFVQQPENIEALRDLGRLTGLLPATSCKARV
jgi:hypothetical protein